VARFSRLEVLNRMIEIGIVPVFYNDDVETSKQVISACSAGGAKVVEFTNRGDLAYQVFSELIRHFAKADPGLILGVGSVVDAPTAALYISSGANFVVGPTLNAEVARVCNRRKVAYSPGCGSASEISEAEELGVEIVKVFPGSEVGGPSFIKSVLGPMPWTRIMPTGGVQATEESVSSWIKAGAACLGMGSDLIKKDLVAAGDWEGISGRASRAIGWARRARGQSLFGPVEHVGLYPSATTANVEMAEWYSKVFGWKVVPAGSSENFFATAGQPGWLEMMKGPEGERPHIGVSVGDFEAAVEELKARGYELDEPKISPTSKLVYLKERDPAGNLVHIVWRA
jgi:2-dehydro-3-deoxyphosphogluconate aldolase / (4S)-4-hydroxy-2-oxoglutarate aldolase